MKKIKFNAVILALGIMLLAFSIASCGENKSIADVHVFYYTYSDPYITSVRSTLGKELKEKGLSFQDYDGNGNQTTQTEQIQTAVTKGAKVIAVNIVNTGSDDAATGVINIAKNADIPVIFFNREVSDEIVKSYDKCAFVGTDAAEAGHLQGQMIGEYLAENYEKADLNHDGEISYILFKGEEGNNEAIYRTNYAVEDANKALKKAGKKPLKFYDASNPNKYLVDKNGQWSASASNEYMTTALASYSESTENMIEAVICNNDGMAEGAISALNTLGYNTGEGEKNIPVFGVDATDAAKELIKSGKMTGTIKQDGEGMAKAISLIAKNAAEKKDLLSGTSEYNVDDDVSKVRVMYSVYLGE